LANDILANCSWSWGAYRLGINQASIHDKTHPDAFILDLRYFLERVVLALSIAEQLGECK